MSTSQIEWTEESWNPTTGCTKVSTGCKHCYAEKMAKRLKAMGVKGYEKGFAVRCHKNRLQQPLSRKKPTIYFVNSMSDLFHEKVPFSFVDKVFEVIEKTPRHTYQILSKRPERMADYCRLVKVPDNAWLGVSVENKQHGLPRVKILQTIDCRVRFLSCEPLLENLGRISLKNIHWVIVGGESGKNARPMKKEWAENVCKQCREKNVAFFFKQWGAWGDDGVKRSKKLNGRVLDSREWNEFPITMPL